MKIFLPLLLALFGYVILTSVGNHPSQNDIENSQEDFENQEIIQNEIKDEEISQSEATQEVLSPEGTAKVKRIVDGDTIEIETNGVARKVRLIGINTPERNRPYFEEAKNKLSELISGKEVKLEKDVSETDRYGRLLRYIYLGDLFVNLEMVKTGYAQSSSYPPDVKFQDLFRAAETQARQQRIGSWSPDLPKFATYEVANNKEENNAPNPSCPIKGNISSGGKIYHIPGGYYYSKTVIEPDKGERWFCSESEAQKEGWRKSKK